MQTNCILDKCTDFNSSTHVTVYAECLCVFIKILSSSVILTGWLLTHCSDVCSDEFPLPQIDRKTKQVKNSVMKNFICNQFGETRYVKHWKYRNLWMNNNVKGNKNAISQGSVATYLRWDGSCCIGCVANLTRFLAVRKIWKSVKIWQSYRKFKGGNFFET